MQARACYMSQVIELVKSVMSELETHSHPLRTHWLQARAGRWGYLDLFCRLPSVLFYACYSTPVVFLCMLNEKWSSTKYTLYFFVTSYQEARINKVYTGEVITLYTRHIRHSMYGWASRASIFVLLWKYLVHHAEWCTLPRHATYITAPYAEAGQQRPWLCCSYDAGVCCLPFTGLLIYHLRTNLCCTDFNPVTMQEANIRRS